MAVSVPSNPSVIPNKPLLTMEEAPPTQRKLRDNLEGIQWMREAAYTIEKIVEYGDIDTYNLVKNSKNMADCSKYLTKHKKITSRSREKQLALVNKQQQRQIKVFTFITYNSLWDFFYKHMVN